MNIIEKLKLSIFWKTKKKKKKVLAVGVRMK